MRNYTPLQFTRLFRIYLMNDQWTYIFGILTFTLAIVLLKVFKVI